ncbi:MAG: hypothetical protein ACRD0G_09150 [Acidimicrobiales bacterium]
MAAPEYVPVKPLDDVRTYESPPRRPQQWRADRPGDLATGQPRGADLGAQGPDQGYALTLVDRFRGQLKLGGVHERDAVAGCLGVALKRASLLGRAPVVHDWRVAFTVWGFLDDDPPANVVERREKLFAESHHAYYYAERRRIADAVPDEVLKLSPEAAAAHYREHSRA